MRLPFGPPLAPMLARAAERLPAGGWSYEPKWDGFRCVVFRDGTDVVLSSRNAKPLTRYFPEVADAVRAHLPERCVTDGELVVAGPAGLDFDRLSERVHPAASRVATLAASTPASLVVFDVLAIGDEDLREEPFAARRRRLEGLAGLGGAAGAQGVRVTPATTDVALAGDWFERFEGAGLDGVVAKRLDQPYRPGERAWVKVKHERTAEFVVGGFRWYRGREGEGVGSLMLGLYDGGDLVHVGVIGSFTAERRKELVGELSAARHPRHHPWQAWSGHGAAGASRWSAGRETSFEPLAPELAVEAAFEHLQGRRLRHTARFRRWRPDRHPEECTFEQVEVAVPALLDEVFAAGG